MSERSFYVTFEGPDVTEHGVPVDDLVGVFGHFQTAVRRMAEYRALKSNSPTVMRELFREAGTLRLRGTSQGSLVAEMELAEPTKLVDFGPEALDEVLVGMEDPFAQLPVVVAREVAAIPAALHPGVSSVTFRGGRRNRTARLIRDNRFQEPDQLAPPPERMTVSGRLLEVDWDERTAELHSPTGVIPLYFDDRLADQMQSHARKHLFVVGVASISNTGRISRLAVEDMGESSDDMAFWVPDPAADIRSQNIRPFHTDAGARLSEHTDVDDFLEAIYN